MPPQQATLKIPVYEFMVYEGSSNQAELIVWMDTFTNIFDPATQSPSFGVGENSNGELVIAVSMQMLNPVPIDTVVIKGAYGMFSTMTLANFTNTYDIVPS